MMRKIIINELNEFFFPEIKHLAPGCQSQYIATKLRGDHQLF